MYEILSAIPNKSIAARVSPPPAIEKASLSAIARATISVPLRKLGNSNTPTGPFQRMVFAFFRISARRSADSSPKSRICSSSLIALLAFSVASAVSENSVATRTSVGTGIWQLASNFFASGIRSASYSERPTLLPSAAMKVFAIPPPTISWSAILDRESNTVSLVETLEPPTIATIGRAGLPNALPNASNSLLNSGPAHATGENLATPCVDA